MFDNHPAPPEASAFPSAAGVGTGFASTGATVFGGIPGVGTPGVATPGRATGGGAGRSAPGAPGEPGTLGGAGALGGSTLIDGNGPLAPFGARFNVGPGFSGPSFSGDTSFTGLESETNSLMHSQYRRIPAIY